MPIIKKTECKSIKENGKMTWAKCKVNGKKLSKKESIKLAKELEKD